MQHSLLDIKCAYFFDDIDKEIHIREPDDYIILDKTNHVLKLNKALYGLHQVGKCWYEELYNKLLTN